MTRLPPRELPPAPSRPIVVLTMGLPGHDYALEKLALETLERARAEAGRHRLVAAGRSSEEVSMDNAVHAFIDGWNAHSPAAVREAFVPGGRVYDPANRGGVSGADLEASVRRALDRLPDVSFTLLSVLETGDGRVAFEWRLSATAVGPDGRSAPVTLEGCDVGRVQDGKLVELRGYFDRARIAEQLAG